jgi:hypothetical protein
MLFQMCYGPEIKPIFQAIQQSNGITAMELRQKFQYEKEGDIYSLIDGVVNFLKDLQMITQENSLLRSCDRTWNTVEILRFLNKLANNEEVNSFNYVFANMYDILFVKPNRLFLNNMHYHVNSKFPDTFVGHEKINAWKRIMEYFGIGRRVYSGFYSLPRISLLTEIISNTGQWDGGLHPFCEEKISAIIPCITSDGSIFNGLLFGLQELHNQHIITLSHKQDLPYKSYGQENKWNWLKVN